jgi:hypothetical protein
MTEQVMIEGRWWVFGKDGDPHYGVLKYDPEDGLELSVKIAKRHTVEEVFSPNPQKAPPNNVICGYDNNNKPVTLFGCGWSGKSTGAGLQTLTFHPMCALLGGSFESWEEAKFNHIHAEFTLLHNWLNRSQLGIGNAPGSGLAVTINELDPIEIPLPDNVRLILQSNSGVLQAKRDLIHHNMFVSFADLQARAPDVIHLWYRLETQLKDALNLYFAVRFNTSLYDNQQFLFLAQALEVYHRSSDSFNGYVQPKAQFRARKKAVIDAVPGEADWLKEKLAHANEKTLAQRLQDLLQKHATLVSRFIQNPSAWADTVRATRNHFTHYSTAEENVHMVAKGSNLVRLAKEMQTLLEICILSDLNITGPPIDRLLHKLAGYHYFSLDDPMPESAQNLVTGNSSDQVARPPGAPSDPKAGSAQQG